MNKKILIFWITLLSACTHPVVEVCRVPEQDMAELYPESNKKSERQKDDFLYVAMGDSVLIDDWPGDGDLNCRCGGASLFFKNLDTKFPDFQGKDLSHLHKDQKPQYLTLAKDGALSSHVVQTQIPKLLELKNTPDLITLSMGGNDLARLLRKPNFTEEELQQLEKNFRENIQKIKKTMDRLIEKNNNLKIIILNIYDPSDGTGLNPLTRKKESDAKIQKLYAIFEKFNSLLKINDDINYFYFDTHELFSNHGFSNKGDYWFHEKMPIDVSQKGAHELRKNLYTFYKEKLITDADLESKIMEISTQNMQPFFQYIKKFGWTHFEEKISEHLSGEQLFAIAEEFRKGRFIEKNDKYARIFYQKSLEKPNSKEETAQNNLGFLYDNGCGVKKNVNKAIDLYHEASAKSKVAECNLQNHRKKCQTDPDFLSCEKLNGIQTNFSCN